MDSPSSVAQFPSSPFSPKKRVGSLVASRMNSLVKDDPSPDTPTRDLNRQAGFRMEKEAFLPVAESGKLTLKSIVGDSPCKPRSPRKRHSTSSKIGLGCNDEPSRATSSVRPQFQRHQSARVQQAFRAPPRLQTQASAPNLVRDLDDQAPRKSILRRTSPSSTVSKSVRFHVCSTRLFDKRLAPRAVSRVRTTHRLMNPVESTTASAPLPVPLPRSPAPRRFSNGEEDAPNSSSTLSPRSPVRRPSPNPASLLQLLVPPPPLDTDDNSSDSCTQTSSSSHSHSSSSGSSRRSATASPSVRRSTFVPPAPLSGPATSPRSVSRPSPVVTSPRVFAPTGPEPSSPSSSSVDGGGGSVGSPKKVNKIQASARGYMQRFRETQGMFETDPAKREQARLRQAQRDRERQVRAAVLLQSAARGYLGRRQAYLKGLEVQLRAVESSRVRELQRIELWKQREMARIRAELLEDDDESSGTDEVVTVDPAVLRAIDELKDQNQALRRSGHVIRRDVDALKEANRTLEARLATINDEISRLKEDVEPIVRSNEQWTSINEMYAAQAARYGPAGDELVAMSASERRTNALIQRTMVRVLERVEQSQRDDPTNNASLFAAALELASKAPWNPKYGGMPAPGAAAVNAFEMEVWNVEEPDEAVTARA